MDVGLLVFALLIGTSFAQPFSPSCNCVVFRLDDIQDWWITPAQRAVLDEFKNTATPLSAGIIAGQFGEDTNIVNYMKTATSTPGWDLDIVSHGWSHEWFSTFSKDAQKKLLSDSGAKIVSVLSPNVQKVVGFIPPFNDFNADTHTALKELGWTTIASQVQVDLPPYSYSSPPGGLYRWPMNSSTSDATIGDYYIGVPAATTLAEIKLQIKMYGFASVMMHPQEFCELDSNHNPTNDVDTDQIAELRRLIQMVKAEGIKMTTFAKIPTLFGQSVPGSTSTTSTTGRVGTTSTTGSTSTSGSTSTTARPTTSTSTSTSSTTGRQSTSTSTSTSTTGRSSTSTSTSTSTTGSAPVPSTTTTTGSSTTSKAAIVFKLETVQDWWRADVAVAIMREFTTSKTPLTVGVIAAKIGTDATITVPLKAAIADCSSKVEIACNGYNFEDFKGMTLVAQNDLLARSKTAISTAFGIVTKMFLPPMGSFNDNTISALSTQGYNIMSAATYSDPAAFTAPVNGLYRLPSGAFTYDLVYGTPVSSGTTWSSCNAQHSFNGFCLISMTPSEFVTANNAINQTMIAELRKLIALAQASGRPVKLLSELATSYGATATYNCKALSGKAKDMEDETYGQSTKTKGAIIITFSVIGSLLVILTVTIVVHFVESHHRRKRREQLMSLHLN